MSKKKIPIRSDPSGDGSASRRPSHRTPLRRSPRLHPETNDDPNSKKNSNEQPQLRSSPLSSDSQQTQKKPSRSLKSRQLLAADASQSRRRSPRLASIAAEVTKKDADFLQSRRRSARFASDLAEIPKKDGDFVAKPKRSERLMGSSKVAAKVAVDVPGDENSDGERGRGEKKRRKREENVEAEMETGRSEVEECCTFEGWTKEQEVALRRAYFSARPSPHFWKKVSKMVPGKTAHECFNRIHADLATPTQPQPRSRANRSNFSPVGSFTLSGSKMKELMETKIKRVRSRKQKSLVAQKTARHLLRKHCLTDRSQEADHFSNLETSPNSLYLELPEIMSPETPDCIRNPSSFLQKCNESSSSSHRKMLSRFNASQADPSPEVLKQIKNIAQHEKYIDHLHYRDARRRKCTKTANPVADRCKKTSSELGTGALKAARTALISEAREYISHFQQMQANSLDNHESFDTDDKTTDTDDYVVDDDDE
ncbi:uncharacterized protein [Elaeis guineensis]|uniref:Uncharacterized protein LOC105057707 n=1 Tax=Elaeis guineensis var. tenera TaxID=51953 RepID=A0A6J0PR44_ELAGV|nr:uncharacterized protein LOC105057707 [Elaeis guineensis]